MPYIFVEELMEGQTEADVVERADYDAIITERDEVLTQRDTAIDRAETAESELKAQKQKYADAFFNTPEGAKRWQNEDVKKDGRVYTFNQLFEDRGDGVAY